MAPNEAYVKSPFTSYESLGTFYFTVLLLTFQHVIMNCTKQLMYRLLYKLFSMQNQRLLTPRSRNLFFFFLRTSVFN